MSAFEITKAIIKNYFTNSRFCCLNFANPDMVGHTGDFNAAVKACEVVDECVSEVVKSALDKKYAILIIADHGNCETMLNSDGSPNTAHTTNPVPIILVDLEKKKLKKVYLEILHLLY